MENIGLLDKASACPDAEVPVTLSPRDGGPDIGVVYTWGKFYTPKTPYIEGVHSVSDLCAGFGAAAAVSGDGSVYHARKHAREVGKLGTCDVPSLSLSSGDGFFAAVGKDHRLYTWGMADQGQLGLGHTRASVVPEPVKSKCRFVQVACGKDHAAALDDAGNVYTFGRGFEGQTGQGLSREPDTMRFPSMAVQLSPKYVKALGVESSTSFVRPSLHCSSDERWHRLDVGRGCHGTARHWKVHEAICAHACSGAWDGQIE